MEMTTTPALKLEGVVKRYSDLTAVDGLTVEVKKGEVIGLLGPNGSGKSTTIKMIPGCYGRMPARCPCWAWTLRPIPWA